MKFNSQRIPVFNPNANFIGVMNIFFIIFYVLYTWYLPMFISFDLFSYEDLK